MQSSTTRPTLEHKLSASFYRKPIHYRAIDGNDVASSPLSSDTAIPASSTLKSGADNADNNNHYNNDNQQQQQLHRHLTLLDLYAIGISGTVGSGLFVLAGLVAHEYAGPAAVVSWGLAGIAAGLSGACYAELSGRIPMSGSTYAFAFVAIGELPALLAAACLSLEYIVASSAVARSWGDKVVVYLKNELFQEHSSSTIWNNAVLFPDQQSFFNPFACFISTATVALLLLGIHESKQVTKLFGGLKIALVIFMIVVGMMHVNVNNWVPFIPTQCGVSGIARGAVSTFFGFLGFDQICGLGGEAVNAKKNLPRAILLTLATVTILYMVATLALTGMQPWTDISPVSGFPEAFYATNAHIAGHVTALGEIATLPIVLLVTVQVQPRLMRSMSVDGLLSPWFQELDDSGNLWNGICFAGVLLILFSTFVPFKYLNDMVSCAVLATLIMTNSSLILMWHEDPQFERKSSNLAEQLILLFHATAIIAAWTITQYSGTRIGVIVSTVSIMAMVAVTIGIFSWCPRSTRFGGRRHHPYHYDLVKTETGYFETPLVPFWPCLAIFVNWYLIAQLEFTGILGLLFFWLIVILYYVFFAVHNSIGGKANLPNPKSVSDTENNQLLQ